MNNSGLKYASMDELRAAAKIKDDIKMKYHKMSCDDVYKTFLKFTEASKTARGDLEQQYIMLDRAGEFAKLIKNKNEFRVFLDRNRNKDIFYRQFLQCVEDMDKIKVVLESKYEKQQLRENTNERAALAETNVNNGKIEAPINLPGPEILPRHSISPKELVRLVEREKKSAIIFDYRLNKSNRIHYINDSLITVILVPNDIVESNLILSSLRNKLDVAPRTLLARLNSYDYVVLMEDDNVGLINGDAQPGTKASFLFKAIFEYSGSDQNSRPKRRPMFLEGGFTTWKMQYPTYTQSENVSTRTSKPRDDLDDMVQRYHRDSSLSQITWPSLISQKQKPIEPEINKPVPSARTETTFGAEGIDQTVISKDTSTNGTYNEKTYQPPSERNKAIIPPRPTAEELREVPRLPNRDSKPMPNNIPEDPRNGIMPAPPSVPSVDRTNKPTPNHTAPNGQPIIHGVPLAPGLNGIQRPQPFADLNNLPNMPPQTPQNGYNGTPKGKPIIPDRSSKPALMTKDVEDSLLSIYEQMVRTIAQSGSKRSSSVPGCTGLYNMGNTCFMSALLQCLFHTPQFSDVFTRENFLSRINPKNKMGTKGVISAGIAALMDVVWSGQYAAIRPQRFLQLFADEVNSVLANGEQHDASEFQMILHASLHEDTNQVIVPASFVQEYCGGKKIVEEAKDYTQRIKKFANSPMNKIFDLVVVSEKRCRSCGDSSATFEDASQLTVELLYSDRQCSLKDCIKSHFAPETFDKENRRNCEKCKTLTVSDRQTHVWTLPPVIVIHLKRFKQVDGEWVKNTAPVAFDAGKLDMAEYLHPAAPRDKLGSYRLYGVTNHSGRLNSGHYTASVMHLRTGKWLRFDDESVSNTDVRSLDYNAAYILFYKRV